MSWWDGKTSPGSVTEDELVAMWERLLEPPAPSPKGRLFHVLPVNRYPGPALQLARHEWFWSWEPPGASVVDRNAGWGMWPDVAELPHLMACHDGLWVPLYVGDPERLTWRRRKWWGRGPIHFDPTGLRRGAAPVPWRNVRTGEIVWGIDLHAGVVQAGRVVPATR